MKNRQFSSRQEIPYFRSPLPDVALKNPRRRGAIRAKGALVHAYADEWQENYSVTDILADLRHYCDAAGLDFGELDADAHSHYLAELSRTQQEAA